MEFHVAQTPVSDDQMHDQQHHDHVAAVNGIGSQVTEAPPQPFPDVEAGEKVLEDDESRIGCEALRFESDVETRPDFTSNIGIAILHPHGLRFAWYVVSKNNHCISFGDHAPFHYFRFTIDPLRFRARCRNHARGLSSPAVNISRKPVWSENPIFCAVNAPTSRFFLQLAGLHDALQLIETPDNFVVEIEPDNTFESTLNCKLDIYKKEGQWLSPTFAFVDPFGWTGFPFSIIQRILKHKSCEVFVNFMYEEINRFLSHPNPKHGENFNILFGTDEWKNGINLKNPIERDRFLHDLYGQQLRKNAKYVRSFRMRNNNNAIDYYLFYATNNLRGLAKMKEAMWKVDETGGFQFSDATDPNQFVLFQKTPDRNTLRKQILDHFNGEEATIREIEEFVLSETAFRETHYKKILKSLEQSKPALIEVIDPPINRRRGTYPWDGLKISFKNSKISAPKPIKG